MSGELRILPQTYLTFRLGTQRLAFEAKHLWEAAGKVEWTEVPRQFPHMVGVTQLHGKIMPILDLAGILGIPRGYAGGSGPGSFIAVNCAGQEEPAAGFLVDEVLGFVKVPVEELQDPAWGPEGRTFPYQTAWSGPNFDLPLLDIERLVTDQSPEKAGTDGQFIPEYQGEDHV